ncbi:MAG: hypothetical protein J7L90_00625 [Dehalococcoidia bacterium]|nr:hypothetical protein [Dehalococcoidia bacterium]
MTGVGLGSVGAGVAEGICVGDGIGEGVVVPIDSAVGIGIAVGDDAGIGVGAGIACVQPTRRAKTTKIKGIRIRKPGLFIIVRSVRTLDYKQIAIPTVTSFQICCQPDMPALIQLSGNWQFGDLIRHLFLKWDCNFVKR